MTRSIPRVSRSSVCSPHNIFFLLFVSLSISHSPASAQPAIAWARTISSSDYTAGSDILVDAQGNVITAGIFREEVSLDNNPHYRRANLGKADIVLIKTTQAGDVIWMRTIGGAGEDRAFRLASDGENNAYLTGSFERVIRFEEDDETHTLESRGKEDMFLVKFNPEGEVMWSVQSGGTRSDQGIGLATDDAGNVYVSGYFEAEALWGVANQQSKVSMGQLDSYLAKYGPDGTLHWVQTLGGDKRDVASGIAVNKAGEVFITGTSRGPQPFWGLSDEQIMGAPQGQDDVFLAHYDQDGTLIRVTYAGGRGFDAGNAITIDAEDNIYLTGYFEDESLFTGLDGTSISKAGRSFDLFVSRFNADGSIAWITSAGGERWDNAYDVDVDNAGNVYVTGLFRDAANFTGSEESDIEGSGEANAFVARYSDSGILTGLRTIDGAKSEGAGIASNKTGEVYLTGLFLQQAMLEEDKMLTSSTFNSFIIKYATDGLETDLFRNDLLDFKSSASLFAISPNYPNPFASNTSFEIRLQESTHIRLLIHDALGRLVDEVVSSEFGAGIYRFVYDASRLAKGSYFYTLETPSSSETRTMTVVR